MSRSSKGGEAVVKSTPGKGNSLCKGPEEGKWFMAYEEMS